ncbi:MAG: hypothetical protein HY222_03105 [Thaumarchaeota archaeon]|nr:hypothetical protein [Nitrososphaerota archaeon]MBI3641363.1 hypothetical protein [Nitrososphaerota archaeon]
MSFTKSKSMFVAAIFSAILMSSAITVPQAMATTPWKQGGVATTSSSATELSGFITEPSLPNSGARPNTFLYLGGWSLHTDNYLNQPDITALSAGWTGFMEVYDLNCNCDPEVKYQSNVTPSVGDSIRFDVYLTSAGNSCQTVKDASTGATATHCFSVHNYGTTFNTAEADLESYDSTSSDFHPMDGTITYTNINQYVSGASSHPIFQASSYNTPPSCLSSTAGSGTVSITLTNC